MVLEKPKDLDQLYQAHFVYKQNRRSVLQLFNTFSVRYRYQEYIIWYWYQQCTEYGTALPAVPTVPVHCPAPTNDHSSFLKFITSLC